MIHHRGRSLLLAGILALTAGGMIATSATAAGFGGRKPMAERCERMGERLERMDRNLSADQIRDIIAGRIAGSGINTLKVGKVTTKDDVVTVEIVTKDGGSLVTTQAISTKTGRRADAGERCERLAERIEKARGEPGQRPRMMMRERRGGAEPRGLLGLGMIAPAPGGDLNLSTDQVKTLTEAALIRAGNPRLKVGAVKAKDADTITVDIVTQDNALVLQRDVNRHTGGIQRRG
jgi:hypothetical protein